MKNFEIYYYEGLGLNQNKVVVTTIKGKKNAKELSDEMTTNDFYAAEKESKEKYNVPYHALPKDKKRTLKKFYYKEIC